LRRDRPATAIPAKDEIMTEPLQFLNVGVYQQRAAELWAIRKMRSTVIEYRALSDRFADATLLMQLACNNENYGDFCAAWISMNDISIQTSFLNDGIKNAILACQKREF
jgi:hypothetical protein